MSTPAAVIIKDNLEYFGIYVHSDGYPQGVGGILKEHYTTAEQIFGIINLGDLSRLAPSIEAPEGHSFWKPQLGYTVAYMRDRGDDGRYAYFHESLDDVLKRFELKGVEFYYLFDPAVGKWKVSPVADERFFVEF